MAAGAGAAGTLQKDVDVAGVPLEQASMSILHLEYRPHITPDHIYAAELASISWRAASWMISHASWMCSFRVVTLPTANRMQKVLPMMVEAVWVGIVQARDVPDVRWRALYSCHNFPCPGRELRLTKLNGGPLVQVCIEALVEVVQLLLVACETWWAQSEDEKSQGSRRDEFKVLVCSDRLFELAGELDASVEMLLEAGHTVRLQDKENLERPEATAERDAPVSIVYHLSLIGMVAEEGWGDVENLRQELRVADKEGRAVESDKLWKRLSGRAGSSGAEVARPGHSLHSCACWCRSCELPQTSHPLQCRPSCLSRPGQGTSCTRAGPGLRGT